MHSMQITIWALALALTISAALLDWRSRRIPNLLTVPGLLLGVLAHGLLSGWHGVLTSLEGAGLALVILLPLVLLRGLGAGDWKLMFVLLGSFLASGVMALAQMMRTGRVVETFQNLWILLKGFFSFGLRSHPQISLDNPKLMKLPFGVAVAFATVICFCAARFVA